MFSDLLDEFLVCFGEGLAVDPIQFGVGVTPWTHVLINLVSFGLQDTDAVTVKPVRTTLASDVKPEKFDQSLSLP